MSDGLYGNDPAVGKNRWAIRFRKRSLEETWWADTASVERSGALVLWGHCPGTEAYNIDILATFAPGEWRSCRRVAS